MNISSISEWPLQDPLEDYDAHVARAQLLSSHLARHFPNASMDKVIKLARFIIFALPDLQKNGVVEFSRKKFRLLCTIRIDLETGHLFFFPKGQKAAYGTHRLVKTALCLLPNQQLIPVKKVVPKVPALPVYGHLDADDCIFSDPGLKNAKGIPKAYAMFFYRWKHLNKHAEYTEPTTTKFCLMMEHFDGGLHRLLAMLQKGEIPALSFREKASIIRQMVEAVYTLHTHVDKEGTFDPIAHYDVKPANFLFRIEFTERGGRKFCIAICDFGFHSHVRETPKENDVQQWYIGEEHLYPYAAGTAPELLQEDIDHADFLKADIWALGCACLQFFVPKEDTPLLCLLDAARTANKNGNKENRVEAFKIARRAVLEQRQELIEKAWLLYSQERPLIRVIETMLELNPTRRQSIGYVKQEIERVVLESVFQSTH
jgi:serine/threonine protein kinase